MNRAVEISTGQWVMQLDDDDYLLPGAGAAMLDAIRRAGTRRERAAVRGPHRGHRRRAPARADVPPRAVPGAQGGAAAAAAQLLVRAGAHRGGAPRRPGAGGPVRHHRRRRHRHRHVGAAVLPLRRAVPAPARPARTPSTRRRRRPACGTPARSGRTARSSTEPSPGASCPSAPSGAGRPTGTTSSSSRAPTAGCGCGGGPRRATCCGCSTCRRSATWGVSPKWLPVRVAFTAATAGARRKPV